jgi:glycosyltransferase involved in cell wall biosynthesis
MKTPPEKETVLILGKLPPPFMGPAIATQIILNSSLNRNFNLIHINTQANSDLTGIGKWSFLKLYRNLKMYSHMFSRCIRMHPSLALIPISQSTSGFLKDSIFILIARLTGTKVLIQLRGSNFKNWINNASFAVRIYTGWILSLTSGVIVLGHQLKHLFQSYFKEEQIHVVPNGADYQLPLRTRKNEDVFEIVYLANLQPSKGIEDVIHSMKILKEKETMPFHLTVIGSWRNEQTKENVSAFVEKHHLPVTILTPDKAGNKFQHLVNADVFVFTPREPEGHPWVIVEAMACGLPIIATNQGAITESVIHEQNGFIVQPFSPDEISEKLSLLMHHASLRSEMGKQSRRLYELHFTENSMVNNLTAVFNQIIRKQ